MPAWIEKRWRLLTAVTACLGMLCATVAFYSWRTVGSSAQDPGIHLLSGLGPAVAYLIETTQGLVLVDCGLEQDCRSLKRQVAALGLDLGRLKRILLTHAHGDHFLGAEHLRTTTGAKVYAGRGDCSVLRAGGPRDSVFSAFPMPGVAIHSTVVDVELTGGERLDLGDARIEAVATPGHTPGSMCYLLKRRRGPSALFSGDTIMSFSQFGTYQLRMAPKYGGNAYDYLTSIQKLQTLPAPDLLLPGHPGDSQGLGSNMPTPSEWQALLARGVAEVEQLIAQQQADGADFLDDVPKQIVSGVYSLGELGGRSVYCLNSSAGLVLFDAPGPGLVEFLRRRLPIVGLELGAITAVFLTSCDSDTVRDLCALVEGTRCSVAAAEEGLAAIAGLCPAGTTLLAAGRQTTDWHEIEAISLSGRGHAPTAYRCELEGKTVLISGRIPVPMSRRIPPPISAYQRQELRQSLLAGDSDAETYLASLQKLAEIRPHVWLPAVPLVGQNANLYGTDWLDSLELNEHFMRHFPDSPRP